MKKKKEFSVNCKAFPGESMQEKLLAEWCKNNQHRKKCLGKCILFPQDGPEISIYQKNKSKKKDSKNA
jgi:hypothetical protein